MSEFYSCPMIASFQLTFEGRIDAERCISLCCEKHISNIPSVGFAETPEETLERFLGLRVLAAAECMNNTANLSYGCAKCPHLRKATWQMEPRIGGVNLSMYPAPCQSKCLYCCEAEHLNQRFTPEVKAAYEEMFDFLEYAKKRGIIEPTAIWQVSSGEITLHPYKDRIMELVRDRHAFFFTNAFIFDEAIAQKLHDDPDSAIKLSIDAGTPETWSAVKGFDNFNAVVSNLRRYREYSAKPGQIKLKYIILPDVNDKPEDFRAVVELAKELGIRHLTLARDTEKKLERGSEYHEKLLGAAARLMALCKSSGITNDTFTYSANDQAEVVKRAERLLKQPTGCPLEQPIQSTDAPSVSVVIPVHNGEAYLRECLDSVVSQTLRDIEIICVNDGSTDDSLSILEAYRERDSRITVISQANSGPGVARNLGLQLAAAPYVMFLDADDMLSNGQALRALYEKAIGNQLDIAICSACDTDAENNRLWECGNFHLHYYLPRKRVFTADDLGDGVFRFSGPTPWSKLYRRQFLLENDLRFLELPRSEDFYFAQLATLYAERIGALPEIEVVRHRVDLNSRKSLEQTKDESPLAFWEGEKRFIDKLKADGFWEKTAVPAKYDAVYRIQYNLLAMNTFAGYKTVFDRLNEMIAYIGLDEPDFEAARDRDPWFAELYQEFQRLKSLSLEEYLHLNYVRERNARQSLDQMIARENNSDITWRADKLQYDLDCVHSSVSFRIGRAITFLPRKLRGGVRCYREHGLRYTYERLLIHLRLRKET